MNETESIIALKLAEQYNPYHSFTNNADGNGGYDLVIALEQRNKDEYILVKYDIKTRTTKYLSDRKLKVFTSFNEFLKYLIDNGNISTEEAMVHRLET